MAKNHTYISPLILSVTIGLTGAALLLLGLARPAGILAASATLARTYELPAGGCQGFGRDVVSVAAHPNSGHLWPNALVKRGTPVQLIGTAETQAWGGNPCAWTTTPLPFTWSATFQDPAGNPATNANGSLLSTSTLSPTLNANNAGIFVVSITTSNPTIVATLTVEVIDDGFRWINIGPDAYRFYSGRVNSIAFDPTTPGTLYIGTGQGGVWKSSDGGTSWRPMTDNKGFPTQGIGSLAVASDGAVYAGTGDPNGTGDSARPGGGVYKSTDGGVTWSSAGGPGSGCAMPTGGLIRKILPHPSTPSLLYAAGADGIYRSTDSGACWTPIYVTTMAFDLTFLPGDASRLYMVARTVGVLRTMDPTTSSPTWEIMSVSPPGTILNAGFATSPAAPQTLYVDAVYFDTQQRVGIYRSADRGDSWTSLTLFGPNANTVTNCTWNGVQQCAYDFAVAADPNNANIIFHGETPLWRIVFQPNSSIGVPSDWSGVGAGVDIHADAHAMLFDPANPTRLYLGTDGGVYRFDFSGDYVNSPTNWTILNYNMTIGQFRSLGVSPIPLYPPDVAGGMQDNGTQVHVYGRRWAEIRGGDGWWTAYDAGAADPSILYLDANAGFNGNIISTLNTNNVVGAANMFAADPFRTSVLIADSPVSSQYPVTGTRGQLFYAANAASGTALNWTCIDPTPGNALDRVQSFAPARINLGDRGWYYVGNDQGTVYLVDVAPALPIYPVCGAGQSATRTVRSIYQSSSTAASITGLSEDPAQPCLLYATLSAGGLPAAERVVRLSAPLSAGNCGTFTSETLGTGLTTTVNIHAHAISADPISPTLVYVGTDAGLFVAQQHISGWQWSRSLDVPDTTVTDIRAAVGTQGPLGTLYASTYGRGVYQRVRSTPSTPVSGSSRPQSVSNSITRCQLREHADGNLSWRYADLEVDYTYSGDHGDNVRLRPLVTINGVVSPYFIREVVHAATGSETANMQVIYGAADAPPGLTSDALKVEMFVEGGGSFLVGECHFGKTWRRDDARAAEVRAEDLSNEGAPSPAAVPVTVTLSNGVVETHQAPFTLVVTQGLTVTLQAPLIRFTAAELRVLHRWARMGQAEASGTSFSFVASDDASVVVRYLGLDHALFLPVIVR